MKILIDLRRIIFPLVQRRRLGNTSQVNLLFRNIMQEPVLYHKLEDVLEVLQNVRYEDSPGVKELLEEYSKIKESADSAEGGKKYPFVVFEGLDGCGKSTTSKKFAKAIEATQYRTPPSFLDHIRPFFDEDKTLRTAFYALGNYIGAIEIEKLLKTSPVVLDRFWHSTAAYAIAQSAEDFPELYPMPLKDDPIYIWPKDLLKPDLIFYLDVTEKNRMIRLSRRTEFTKQEKLIQESSRFRNNITQAYKNLYPEVTFIDSNKKPKDVVNDLEKRYMDYTLATK